MGQYISRYLNIVDLESSALLFNGVNGCLDEVPQKLADILRSGDPERLGALGSREISLLARRGHLTVLSPAEELDRFKAFSAALHKRQEGGTQTGGIMLLMSYNCNLACKYCYQQEHRPHKSRAVMTPELVESIFEKKLAAIIPGASHNNFSVSFYGGEPFLPTNEATIRKALSYTKKYGMKSSAITNATMADQMADIFGEGPGFVNSVQISLDGCRELHDQSRIPASGEATYDKIVANISMLLKRKTRVSIRLNLDRRTMASIPQLVQDLKEKGILGNRYASVYASPLHDNLAAVDATDFMALAELSAQVFNLGIDLEHPVSLRANEMSYLFSLEKGLGLTHTCFCMQTMQRTLVVDPFGDLYACFEEAGYPQYRVGHISEAGVEFFPLHETYRTRHVANMDECLKCSVALACGGQCGVRCRAKTGDLFRPCCQDIKQVILDGLKLAYQKKQKRTQSKIPAPTAEPMPSTHG